MSMYYQRPPRRKGALSFFMPLFILGGLIIIALYGWNALKNNLWGADEKALSVFLNIDQGSAKAMTAGKREWQGAIDQIKLFQGESLKTSEDGRSTLTFFDNSVMRLDGGTEIRLDSLKKRKEVDTIDVRLNQGNLWTTIDKKTDGDSSVQIQTALLTLSAKSGVFALSAPGTVYMIEGFADVNVSDAGKILKTYSLGVGQQLTVNEALVESLKRGENPDVIFAMSDEFKTSPWFAFNRMKDGVPGMEALLTENPETETAPAEGAATETGTSSTTATAPSTESASTTTTTTTTSAPTSDPNDKTPPPAPVIVEPGKTGSTVKAGDVVISLKGTVSEDTEKVIVDDYTLAKYVPGSKTWAYSAKVVYGNLKVGNNVYKVYAEDKAGNRSAAATITVTLDQAVVDAAKAESETGTPSASNSGGVKFTAPNNGENFTSSESAFELIGEVPSTTAKIVVNDYTLKNYVAGSTSFKYKASSSLGNLALGKINTYTAKAYDAEGTLIGSARISIDVQSGEASAPVITIPTDAATYSTTLSELAVGGTVGKWVQSVSVNGEKLSSYTPGSEKWSTTVQLNPGANTITVNAEKDGASVGSDSIVITLE